MILTAPTKDDCELVRIWRNDCLESLRTPYLLTQEMQYDFYENVCCDRKSNHRYWSVFNDGKLVGFAGLTNIQYENRIAEISLMVNPDYRGTGIGERIVDMILAEGFNYLNLKTIFGEVYLANKAVDFWRKITERYKGYITVLPNTKFWEGKFYDSMYFSIDSGAFNEQKLLDNSL